jgi:hypothetical protein
MDEMRESFLVLYWCWFRERERELKGRFVWFGLVFLIVYQYTHFHLFISFLNQKCGPHLVVSNTTNFFLFLHMNYCEGLLH